MDTRLQSLEPKPQTLDAKQLINDLLSCNSEKSDQSYLQRVDELSDKLKKGFNQKSIVLTKEHAESFFEIRQELQRRIKSNAALKTQMMMIDGRLEFLYNRALQGKNQSDSKNQTTPSALPKNADEKYHASSEDNTNFNQLLDAIKKCEEDTSNDSYLDRIYKLVMPPVTYNPYIVRPDQIEALVTTLSTVTKRSANANFTKQETIQNITKRLSELIKKISANVDLGKANLLEKIREEIKLLEDKLLILIKAEQFAMLNLSAEAGSSIAKVFGINQKKNAENFLKWHENCSSHIYKISPLSAASEVSSRIQKFITLLDIINSVLEFEEKTLPPSDFDNKYGCMHIFARAALKSPKDHNTFDELLNDLNILMRKGYTKEAVEFCNWINKIYNYADVQLNETQLEALTKALFSSSTASILRKTVDSTSLSDNVAKEKELSEKESIVMALEMGLSHHHNFSAKTSTDDEKKKNEITPSSVTTNEENEFNEEAMLARAIAMSMEKDASTTTVDDQKNQNTPSLSSAQDQNVVPQNSRPR